MLHSRRLQPPPRRVAEARPARMLADETSSLWMGGLVGGHRHGSRPRVCHRGGSRRRVPDQRGPYHHRPVRGLGRLAPAEPRDRDRPGGRIRSPPAGSQANRRHPRHGPVHEPHRRPEGPRQAGQGRQPGGRGHASEHPLPGGLGGRRPHRAPQGQREEGHQGRRPDRVVLLLRRHPLHAAQCRVGHQHPRRRSLHLLGADDPDLRRGVAGPAPVQARPQDLPRSG